MDEQVIVDEALKQYAKAETMTRPSFIIICPRCGSRGTPWQKGRRFGDEVEMITLLKCVNRECRHEEEL